MSTTPRSPELLLGQQVADVAQVQDMDPVHLDREGDLLATFRASRIVSVGPDAGDQDFLDLVLTRPIEDERVIQAGREEGLAVA